MVLKRRKNLKTICKNLVRPGLMIGGGVGAGGADNNSETLTIPMSVSTLSLPLRNNNNLEATTDVRSCFELLQRLREK